MGGVEVISGELGHKPGVVEVSLPRTALSPPYCAGRELEDVATSAFCLPCGLNGSRDVWERAIIYVYPQML